MHPQLQEWRVLTHQFWTGNPLRTRPSYAKRLVWEEAREVTSENLLDAQDPNVLMCQQIDQQVEGDGEEVYDLENTLGESSARRKGPQQEQFGEEHTG